VYNENIKQLWVGIIWERAEYIWHVDNKKIQMEKMALWRGQWTAEAVGPAPQGVPSRIPSLSVEKERERERESRIFFWGLLHAVQMKINFGIIL
jgi:hypothetical protein